MLLSLCFSFSIFVAVSLLFSHNSFCFFSLWLIFLLLLYLFYSIVFSSSDFILFLSVFPTFSLFFTFPMSLFFLTFPFSLNFSLSLFHFFCFFSFLYFSLLTLSHPHYPFLIHFSTIKIDLTAKKNFYCRFISQCPIGYF